MNAPAPVELRGPFVTLRTPLESDVEPLLAVLNEPEVAYWWVGYDAERIREEFLRAPGEGRIIDVGGAAIGGMLILRSDDPEYPTTVMHIFISTAYRGRRIGEEALALAIRHEFSEGITRVTLDPNAKNVGAIRSYERLGFRRVGILRDYQLRESGALDDALFMDLTRSDFPDGPPLPQRS